MDEQISGQEFIRRFLEKIRDLPPEQAMLELMDAMDVIVKHLDRESLIEVRDLVAKLHPDSPEIVDLIDGNLALREIRGIE